jgi:outer membrane protein insertion porin family
MLVPFGEELTSLDDIVYSSYSRNDISKLVEQNQSLPVTVQSLEVTGANAVRASFLKSQVAPIIDGAHTLPSLLEALGESASRLQRFGIFEQAKFSLDLADPLFSNIDAAAAADASAHPAATTGIAKPGAPLDIKALLSVNRTNKMPISLRTVIQDDVAGVVAKGALTNLFGGAESLTVQAAIDTKPRTLSSYTANFATPLNGSPDLQAHISVFHQMKDVAPYAPYAVQLKGVSAKVISASPRFPGSAIEVGVEGVERIVAAADAAEQSPANVKTAVFARFAVDRRNNKVYPSDGYLIEGQTELSGVVGNTEKLIKSDVAFLKTAAAASYAKSLDPGRDRLVFNLHLGTGLLWNYPRGGNVASNILDRFYLGGKASGSQALLYGYQYNGLGPKDGQTALGGDAYTLGSVSFLGKLPRLSGSLSPLRFLVFFSGGSLIPAVTDAASGGAPSLVDTLKQLRATAASTSAGAGLVYRSQQAQLELVYAVPLNSKPEDFMRRGLQFNVGLELDL